jgi:hypothetical protein
MAEACTAWKEIAVSRRSCGASMRDRLTTDPERCSSNVTVQVPLSIFLDKSLRIGYRMVDECENGSPRRAIKYSGE